MAQRCGNSPGRRKVDLFRNIELLSSDEAVLLLMCFDGFYEHLGLVERLGFPSPAGAKAAAAERCVAMEQVSALRLANSVSGLARDMVIADSGSITSLAARRFP
jgi:hypothetical protein